MAQASISRSYSVSTWSAKETERRPNHLALTFRGERAEGLAHVRAEPLATVSPWLWNKPQRAPEPL